MPAQRTRARGSRGAALQSRRFLGLAHRDCCATRGPASSTTRPPREPAVPAGLAGCRDRRHGPVALAAGRASTRPTRRRHRPAASSRPTSRARTASSRCGTRASTARARRSRILQFGVDTDEDLAVFDAAFGLDGPAAGADPGQRRPCGRARGLRDRGDARHPGRAGGGAGRPDPGLSASPDTTTFGAAMDAIVADGRAQMRVGVVRPVLRGRLHEPR